MGRSICEQFAARGHRVAVFDVNAEAADAVADDLRDRGGQALAFAVDVADRGVGRRRRRARCAASSAPSSSSSPAPGISMFEPFLEITLESWNRIIEVNLTGTFHCVQAIIPDMVAAEWGRIVTISSSSAQRGSPRMAHYAASKGGVITLTKTLAREFAPYGITVNNIPPSAIETPMQHQAQVDGYLPSNEAMAKTRPARSAGHR